MNLDVDDPLVTVTPPGGGRASDRAAGTLWTLTEAAVAINSTRSLDEMLRTITEHACQLVGAHLGSTSLTIEGTGAADGWPQQLISVSMSDKYAAWRDYAQPSSGAAMYGLVCAGNRVVRLTDDELKAHPAWTGFGEEADRHPPMRGWLAAPLVASDGSNIGMLQLSDRYQGEFEEADEAILVQLAQLASIAVEKAQLLAQRDRQADQLRVLADAAVVISSPLGVRETLERITEVASRLIGAHQAVTSLTAGRDWSQAIAAVHLSEKYAAWGGYDPAPDGSGIYALVCSENRPLRLTQAELEVHPAWRGFGTHAAGHPPMRGWLAMPLMTVRGENIGLIQLSDKFEGEFSAEDEALLTQVARLASVALENAELRQAALDRERQQLLQDLIAGLSHDMQTPLAVIAGLARLLDDDVPFDDAQRGQVRELLGSQTARLRRQVGQFLDYLRLEAGRPLVLQTQPVDVAALLTEAVQPLSAWRSIRIEPDPVGDPLETDPDRLAQVVVALVSNAIKFSDQPIGVRVARQVGSSTIEVRDQGPGIHPTELPLIFDRFYRSEASRRHEIPGHGLGLYIARGLVEAMGGTLTVTSDVGVGSRFLVTLPNGAPHER